MPDEIDPDIQAMMNMINSPGPDLMVSALVLLAIVTVVYLLNRPARDWQPCPRPASMGPGHPFVMRKGSHRGRVYREMTDAEKTEWDGMLAW